MKKRLLGILLCIFMTIGITGCESNKEKTLNESQNEETSLDVSGSKDELELIAAYTFDYTIKKVENALTRQTSDKEQYVFLIVDVDSKEKEINIQDGKLSLKIDSKEYSATKYTSFSDYKERPSLVDFMRNLTYILGYKPLAYLNDNDQKILQSEKKTRTIVAFKVDYANIVNGNSLSLYYKFNEDRTGAYEIEGLKTIRIKSLETIEYLDELLKHEEKSEEKQMIAELRWKYLRIKGIMDMISNKFTGSTRPKADQFYYLSQCLTDTQIDKAYNMLSNYFEDKQTKIISISNNVCERNNYKEKICFENEVYSYNDLILENKKGIDYDIIEEYYPKSKSLLEKLNKDSKKLGESIKSYASKVEAVWCTNLEKLEEFDVIKEDFSKLIEIGLF